ncbi:hypothetical protein [Nevskia soli]|uniref:hypothetical protein n=1 Tax=Nevskia soli TaxID=418856 RepID=UPI0012FACAB9|nr:hypothetical protein [Nevskia soli]
MAVHQQASKSRFLTSVLTRRSVLAISQGIGHARGQPAGPGPHSRLIVIEDLLQGRLKDLQEERDCERILKIERLIPTARNLTA